MITMAVGFVLPSAPVMADGYWGEESGQRGYWGNRQPGPVDYWRDPNQEKSKDKGDDKKMNDAQARAEEARKRHMEQIKERTKPKNNAFRNNPQMNFNVPGSGSMSIPIPGRNDFIGNNGLTR